MFVNCVTAVEELPTSKSSKRSEKLRNSEVEKQPHRKAQVDISYGTFGEQVHTSQGEIAEVDVSD